MNIQDILIINMDTQEMLTSDIVDSNLLKEYYTNNKYLLL